MNDVLTGIERDVVIDYMRSEMPVLSIRLNLVQDTAFAVPSGQYSVQQSVVIFSERFVPQYAKSLQTEILVSFYFKKRGLFFNSILQSKNNTCAVGIPDNIMKTEDVQISASSEEFYGKLFYAAKNGQTEVGFSSNIDYPLFNPFVWRRVDLSDTFFKILETTTSFVRSEQTGNLIDSMRESRELLFVHGKRFPEKNPFPFKACLLSDDLQKKPASIVSTYKREVDSFSGSVFVPFSDIKQTIAAEIPVTAFSQMAFPQVCEKIMEQLAFVPAVSYLAEKHEENSAVQDRISPLELVYVSERYVTFVCSLKTISFVPMQEYSFLLNVGYRTIKAKCGVRHVFDHDGKTGAVCVFTKLNPEDKRFLYEKIYGTVYK